MARSRRHFTSGATPSKRCQKSSQPAVGKPCSLCGSTGSECRPRPTGMIRSILERSRDRSSGRSLAVSEVFTALMPQPMSTPTAAGQTAPFIAMTEPTVAPLPRWTSGITARPCSQGRELMLRSCCMAWPSTVAGSAHIRMGTRMPGTSVYDMTGTTSGVDWFPC